MAERSRASAAPSSAASWSRRASEAARRARCIGIGINCRRRSGLERACGARSRRSSSSSAPRRNRVIGAHRALRCSRRSTRFEADGLDRRACRMGGDGRARRAAHARAARRRARDHRHRRAGWPPTARCACDTRAAAMRAVHSGRVVSARAGMILAIDAATPASSGAGDDDGGSALDEHRHRLADRVRRVERPRQSVLDDARGPRAHRHLERRRRRRAPAAGQLDEHLRRRAALAARRGRALRRAEPLRAPGACSVPTAGPR